ncbi:MAG: transglutaminase domain-containing protein [Candidatus Omnitrophica bacterium]|nr:transglutaminase domain-containing protein [Candidatus Omnitrophota bacterium]
MMIFRKAFVFLSFFCLVNAFIFANSNDTEPLICVSGIMFDQDSPKAVVNNRVVGQGKTIDQVVVSEINELEVKFEYKGKIFTREIGQVCQVQEGSSPDDSQKAVSRSAALKKEGGSSLGLKHYKDAFSYFNKASRDYRSKRFDRAYIYYDKAIRSAQKAVCLVDKDKREELKGLIERLRARKSELEKAEISDKIAQAEYPRLKSPEDIEKWLSINVRSGKDADQYKREDRWQNPKETMTLGKGDCEDFAFLAQDLLKQIGIESVVLGIVYMENVKRRCHAICVFRRPGRSDFNYFTIFKLIKTREIRLLEFVDFIYPAWIEAFELNLSNRLSTPIFGKTAGGIKNFYKPNDPNLTKELLKMLK